MDLPQRPIWALTPAEVYQAFGTTEGGLSDDEAFTRWQKYGPNELPEPSHRPLWLRFTDQLTHFMAILLWVAGILAFISGTPQLGWAIWAVIWINAAFSFWQEFRAEKALSALKNVLPRQAKVYRDGELKQIPARELVCGDVIQLEEGDRLSADARLISAVNFYLDVSVLTGESLPVARNPRPMQAREMAAIRGGKALPVGEHQPKERLNLAEAANLALAGATVVGGRGKAVVYGTGAQTEFGRVAHLTAGVKPEPSNLELEVARLVRTITAIAVGVGVMVFLLTYVLSGMAIKESFIFAIGIIVALVPEGLLPTVSLSLAIGVRRMARRNALVRRLSSVETLSATQVICTDKTGTLTANEMTTRYLWLPAESSTLAAADRDPSHFPFCALPTELVEISGAGYDPAIGEVRYPASLAAPWRVNGLLMGAALCSNARLVHLTHPSRWQEMGDPTEAALLVAAKKAGLDLDLLSHHLPRVKEIPFDSRRRLMTVVLAKQADADPAWNWLFDNDDNHLVITKGAPLEVLRHCDSILRGDRRLPLSRDDHQRATAANDGFAKEGFRVLGLAVRSGNHTLLTLRSQELEQHLTFVGLVAMFDPPRPEVHDALARCRQAGITVTMVTGDYGLTAAAIARQISLVQNTARIVTGDGMGELSDAQLQQILKYRHNLVFARMSPEHKLRLVQAYKDSGHVVAVTGDGVNDAPALRAAHIGIAMGKNGTDVAREAADIVLTDDNFATIVAAIEEGRAIYENIRKFMTYILASNVAELVPFLLMAILKIPPALLVMQILAIDLGTDLLPALALGTEVAEPGLLTEPPRSKAQPLLDRRLMARAYGFLGLLEALLGMTAFFAVWRYYGYGLADLQTLTPNLMNHTASATAIAIYAQATTMTLATIVACQDGNVFACRSEKTSIFRLGFFSNPLIWLGIAVEWSLMLLITQLPFLNTVFSTAPLAPWQWLALITCPPLILSAEEIRKALFRRLNKHPG